MSPDEFESFLSNELKSNSMHYSEEFSQRFDPISFERLAEIETTYSVVFPNEFKHFLSVFGAGEYKFVEIYTPDASQGNSLWDDFQYMEHMKGAMVPFADNGCGDYYCFKVSEGFCSSEVYWADHEQNYLLTKANYTDFYDFLVSVGVKNEVR